MMVRTLTALALLLVSPIAAASLSRSVKATQISKPCAPLSTWERAISMIES